MNQVVRSGLEVLCARGFAGLRGQRIGLVTHPAAIDSSYRHVIDLLAQAAGLRLTALFGPEHGLMGEAQDLIGVAGCDDPISGLRVHSLYGQSVESLRPTPEQLDGLDVLVVDIQDVGSRYYTFQATMLFCLEAAAQVGLRVVLLDRPNPLGGMAVEGPSIRPGFESFVGIHPVAIRHGMTIGELALLYKAERRIDVELEIIPCDGWRRHMDFAATGLPWVLPSPNMPTLDTAVVYPGQCLIEGTNLSEGRGTTRPFELCGAPWLCVAELVRRLQAAGLPGATFRPAWFRPTFQKFAGQNCGGAQIHVLDRTSFQPVQTSLEILAAMRALSAERFDWRREPYEFVTDRLAIDLLFGSDRERLALEAGQLPAEISAPWLKEAEEFHERRAPFLLYDPR
jgi:uncharacterized protein YbbC (DUF1343 family)